MTTDGIPHFAANKGDLGREDYWIDGPTFALAVAVYALFLTLTATYAYWPWWLILPLGAATICLHGSLQHEAVHGYPFRSRWLNRLVIGWPLWLWLPYDHYERSHLTHHIDENLTDPRLDPESNYLAAEQWRSLSAPHRFCRRIMATLAGRLLIGPIYYAVFVWRDLLREIARGDPKAIRLLLWYIPSLGLVLWWTIGYCGIPFWDYLLFFAYPGSAMTLLRSYAEHRAMPKSAERSVILEAGFFWRLMFLNNNLHALHHAEPGLAWHRRPARYRARKAEWLAANGNYFMPGYFWLAARYLAKAKEPILHPDFP